MNNNPCVNMADFICKNAKLCPNKRAIVFPFSRDYANRVAYTHLTFEQLEDETNRYARGLEKIGITRGTKVVVMLKPSLEFFIAFFALSKIGAIMVMIDPGMGMKNLKKCLGEAEPKAFIGVPVANAARVILGWSRSSIKIVVTFGMRVFWGGHKFKELRDTDNSAYEPARMAENETGAIMFTSGSTGVSKGAVYTHGILTNQVKFIQEAYNFGAEDIDVATFPLFALFDVCLGMTTVIPDMDATKPAKANPIKLIESISDNGATSMFGSPALIDALSRFTTKRKIVLKSLKKVISCGAPARNDILNRFHQSLNKDAEIFTPYGATEALPVSSIGSRMILGETAPITEAGGGTCVGYPNEHVTVRIIKITDEPIAKWSDTLCVKDGEIGEITVKGPIVTREYYRRPKNTALAKIPEGNEVWHRMGDVGRIDEKGRLWFCGRKSHRVEGKDKTWFSIPCERVFNNHEKVFRTALAHIKKNGYQEPVICVELEPKFKSTDLKALYNDLKEIALKFEHTKDICKFIVHPEFPVDVRHNAKINREQLSEWVEEQNL